MKHQLGKTPDGRLGQRDAIHVAVTIVAASCKISPGEGLYISNYGYAEPSYGREPVAIADPFHYGVIETGDLFFALICPWKVMRVRHELELNLAAQREAPESKREPDYGDDDSCHATC